MFVRAYTSESEMRESAQRVLQVADNLNGTYAGIIAKIQKDFDHGRGEVNRVFDFVNSRLTDLEEVVSSNTRLVMALNAAVTPSAVSVEEERQNTDLEDMDHN